MADDSLQDFLRRAAERRQQRQQQQRRRTPDIEIVEPEVVPVEAEVVGLQGRHDVSWNLKPEAQRVGSFDEQAVRLGTAIRLGDKGRDERRQKDKAAHAATAAEAMARAMTAQDLAALLHNPVTLRQAMLLREVLDRPVHRW